MAKFAIYDHSEIIGYGETDEKGLLKLKVVLAPHGFTVEEVQILNEAKEAERAAEGGKK